MESAVLHKDKIIYTPRKEKLKKQIKLLQQTVRRQKLKISNIGKLITQLKKKNLALEQDTLLSLLVQKKFSDVPLHLIKNMILNQKKSTHAHRYLQEIKEFAATLHYKSPKTYNFCWLVTDKVQYFNKDL